MQKYIKKAEQKENLIKKSQISIFFEKYPIIAAQFNKIKLL